MNLSIFAMSWGKYIYVFIPSLDCKRKQILINRSIAISVKRLEFNQWETFKSDENLSKYIKCQNIGYHKHENFVISVNVGLLIKKQV